MFDKLLNMFINKDNLNKKEKSNLADVLEPARPGEVDPSVLKAIQEPIEDAELDDNLDMDLEESKEMHNPDSKKEESMADEAEKLRDELFSKFKLKNNYLNKSNLPF